MDWLVAIEKIHRAGYLVPFPFFSNHNDRSIAHGWLRVSHRELDEQKSEPYRPVHKHQREMKLKAGEPVPVETGDNKLYLFGFFCQFLLLPFQDKQVYLVYLFIA